MYRVKSIVVLFLLVLLFGAGAAYSQIAEPAVDAVAVNWNTVPILIQDPAGDGGQEDLVSLQITNDTERIQIKAIYATLGDGFTFINFGVNPTEGCPAYSIEGLDAQITANLHNLQEGSFIGNLLDCAGGAFEFPGALWITRDENILYMSFPINVLRTFEPNLTDFLVNTAADLSDTALYTLISNPDHRHRHHRHHHHRHHHRR